MLNLKICLLDFTGQNYDINSLYTESLSRSQLELLYLGTALSVRPNRITLMHERESAKEMHSIQILPFPKDPKQFWSSSDYDLVICLDSLEGSQELRDYLPTKTTLILWTHLPPEHISMLALKDPKVNSIWSGIVCETASIKQGYIEQFQLPETQVHYRYPSIVRSLRQRFATSTELTQLRNPELTLAYTALPHHGLEHLFNLFQLLQEAFSKLQLRILLPPNYEESLAEGKVQKLLATCRKTSGVKVLESQPWPAYVEELLKCHILCNPLGFFDTAAAYTIDALAAGCQVISIMHPSIQEIAHDLPIWISHEPADDYLERYNLAVGDYLKHMLNNPEHALKRSFAQVAAVNTYYTWDLRVWEWESLFFKLLDQDQIAA